MPLTLTGIFNNIANAIRQRGNTSNTISPINMADAINSINVFTHKDFKVGVEENGVYNFNKPEYFYSGLEFKAVDATNFNYPVMSVQ